MSGANAYLLVGATFLTTCLVVSKGNLLPSQDEKVEYKFRTDVPTMCSIVLAGRLYTGALDARGNFVWDPALSAGISGPGILNMSDDEPVYEYRSGYLIKGVINEHLKFVPELGSKVTSFKDYRYSKNAIRIYNLPGEFREKGCRSVPDPIR